MGPNLGRRIRNLVLALVHFCDLILGPPGLDVGYLGGGGTFYVPAGIRPHQVGGHVDLSAVNDIHRVQGGGTTIFFKK